MQRCHFIGIGGIGMSGLAKLLIEKNVDVSGSDLRQSPVTEKLSHAGATIHYKQCEEHIDAGMSVIYSSDIPTENSEYQSALKQKCQMLHRSDLLALLMSQTHSLAVAGTHGKTTTSALLAAVLHEGGYEPSFAIGGIIPQFETNAKHGNGNFFVAEADESDGTFTKYFPNGAIITNIDDDHLNHYGTSEICDHAFKKFSDQVKNKQHLFWCGDDQRLQKLSLQGISYGFESHNPLRIISYEQQGWEAILDIAFDGKIYRNIKLALIGRHNALNALAVFGMSLSLGVSVEAIQTAFSKFSGVKRRCEKVGHLVIDDYAHHPTEVAATLSALRKAFPYYKLIALFQPHRYSRLKHVIGTFGSCFEDADDVIITDIYASGEKSIPGVTAQKIAEEVGGRYLPKEELLGIDLFPHDVLITLGAGDIYKVGMELAKKKRQRYSVAVLCGGRSPEHHVSLHSAKHVTDSLSRESYIVKQHTLPQKAMPATIMEIVENVDVLFPIFHGPNGEDGTIQGFFEMIDKPYVGCDHRASAVAMDKVLTKQLLSYHAIPTAPFFSFRHYDPKFLETVSTSLQFPIFVKGAHFGSSIGVIKVEDLKDLKCAIREVLACDDLVIVEQGISGREIEFAVLGDRVFPPGEILVNGEMYDFSIKYGQNAVETATEANLSQDLIKKGCALAKKAFDILGCYGIARIDAFLDKNQQFWINEVNPIPGCTQTSLYPKICERWGVSSEELMDTLVKMALARHRQQSKREEKIIGQYRV